MSHNNKGLFITFEGVEGVGKTTQIQRAAHFLKEQGKDIRLTREPGGTPLAEDIRKVLLAPREGEFSYKTELLLMFAARAAHLEHLIWPEIEAGKWVLCDRFTDATYAYQSGGRGLDAQEVALLEDYVQADFRPNLTILLDAPVELGMQRAKGRGDLDRFEQEKLTFFEQVRQCYLTRAANDPDRFIVIDASLSLDQVTEQMLSELKARI